MWVLQNEKKKLMFEVVNVKTSTHEWKTKKKNILEVLFLRVCFPQLLQCEKNHNGCPVHILLFRYGFDNWKWHSGIVIFD